MKKLKPAITRTILNEIFSPQLSRSEQSKIKIVELAISTFAQSSEELLNYEEIARKGKLNRSLVNYYFPEKKDLFLTAIKYVRATHQELAVQELSRSKTPKDVFKSYVDTTFIWIDKLPEHVKTWILFWFLCSSGEELKTLHSSLTDIGRERIEGILESLDHKGGRATPKKLEYVAKSVQRIITGAVIEAMSENKRSRAALRKEVFQQALDLLKQNGFII